MRKKLIVTAAIAISFGTLVFPAKQPVGGEGLSGPRWLWAPASAQGGSESITMTTVPNGVTRYVFGAADGFPDTVVKKSLRSACSVRITRIPVQANDIANRCRDGGDPSLRGLSPVLEMRNPSGATGPGQFSIYRIDVLGACPPAAFPVQIDILYFGQPGEADIIKTRVIRDSSPPAPTNCSEVTSDISTPKDPSDLDPKGSGSIDTFSDYFLANLPSSSLPTQMAVDSRFTDLRDATTSLLRSELSCIVTAQSQFDLGASQVEQGNLNGAQVSFQMSIGVLDQFLNVVEDKRRSGILTPGDASALTTRAKRLRFHIRAYAKLKGIELQ